jgi:ATP-dependent RNA helicase HelY
MPKRNYAASIHSANDFIAQFEFGFDDFQIKACHAVEDGTEVLVAAPTWCRKDCGWRIRRLYSASQRKGVFLHDSYQALSNQKYFEFVERFGEERVGLLTGDTNVNS